jgi:hypothetical protein
MIENFYNYKIEQKKMIEYLEKSMTKTKNLTCMLNSEMANLKLKNSSLRLSSNKICDNLETTMEDAIETQAELFNIEKIFRATKNNICHSHTL